MKCWSRSHIVGKFCYVSGKSISKTNTDEIKYSLREQNYGAIIQKAYAFASKSLLELLLKEYDLMGRLKSVKNYFLMSQGDFIVQFMDATDQELSKKIDDIIPSKLESLLGLCLRYSFIFLFFHFANFTKKSACLILRFLVTRFVPNLLCLLLYL